MIKLKAEWVVSFIVKEDGSVLASLLKGRVESENEDLIDTLLIEGAYDIIRQSEIFAAELVRTPKKLPFIFKFTAYLRKYLAR